MKIIFNIIVILLISLLFPLGNILSAANSQALYEQGMEAFKSGNFASSELLLRKLIESGEIEYMDRASYFFALSIFNQKKYQSAIFEFNKFLSSCATLELCSLSRYWIAESYFQQNDYIRAIQEFNRFIAQSKDEEYTAQAFDRIGKIYFIQARYDEAIIEWTKALGKYKDETRKNQKRLNIGEAYFLNENYDEAINFLKPLLNPNIDLKIMSMARMITGRAYQISGKNVTALKIFSGMDESLLTEKPFNEVQYYRALSYIALGNINFAVLHLKTFLSTGKDSKWIYYAKYELAKIDLKENNLKEATELFEDIRKSKAESALKSRASMELSKIYFDDNVEESIKCLNETTALESAEEKKEALLLLSKAYIKIKNYNEAESILEQLMNNYSFDKDMDLFRFLLARVYLEEGDFEKAIKGFNKVKEVNPFSKYIIESYFYLALANSKNNQPDEAINLLNKYVNSQKAERKYDAFVQLLELYTQKRDFKNAEKTASIIINYYIKEKGVENVLYKYAKALTDNHRSGKALFDIIVQRFNKSEAAGIILLAWGDEAFIKKDYKKAEDFYKQYLSVQWRNNAASVFLYRIISLERLGKYKEIVSILDSEKSIPPMDEYTSKQVMLWRAKSLYNTGEYNEAYDLYSNWRLTDLSNEDLLNLTKSSINVDDIITAKRAAELIQSDKNPRAEAFYEISLYFIGKNNLESAIEYLSRIFIECPSSNFIDDAKVEIADIYIKEEKFEEAIKKLKEINKESLQLRKDALLIISYFRIGNDKEAATLSKKYLYNPNRSPYKEIVIKENLLFYYKKKDIKGFNEYAQYLKKYPGNNQLINYLFAKLNFENADYKTSYYYFYKLADVESEFRDEAIYYLGLISLLYNKDTNSAFKYFTKISENSNPENKFAMQGKIDLSILASEMGNIELSKRMLFDILNYSDNRLLRIQAENLVEYFGYKDQKEDIIKQQ